MAEIHCDARSPIQTEQSIILLADFLIATSGYNPPIDETSRLAKNFYCLPLYLEVGETSLYEGYLMGKNRKLMILIVFLLCFLVYELFDKHWHI